MALTAGEKEKVVKGLENYWSRFWEPTDISRQDLISAVDNTDAWIESNQASYNSALPANVQTGLTTLQKTALFCAVALARVAPAWLQNILPED